MVAGLGHDLCCILHATSCMACLLRMFDEPSQCHVREEMLSFFWTSAAGFVQGARETKRRGCGHKP